MTIISITIANFFLDIHTKFWMVIFKTMKEAHFQYAKEIICYKLLFLFIYISLYFKIFFAKYFFLYSWCPVYVRLPQLMQVFSFWSHIIIYP
jgi:hypothetical protein